MLELKNITKDYKVAGEAVHALRGISIKFRKNEFVSILGASGCGKTTLLNIIGGLDKYTSGDLLIQGISTKKYNDRDWDTYRNHSIGFIFQSYHLIPHQTILQNVELALTISGVSKEERRRRAIEALEKVGLADKIKNKPNQLSGGQAQRVAIARALINDPEIVLADEPTGALDSKTSVQIMELLKEISKDRLVIMVTHNPELAEQYSTRIVRLLDGEIIDDSMPYDGDASSQQGILNAETQDRSSLQSNEKAVQDGATKTNKGRKKRTSMSIGMSFMLSLKNLLSKSKRTAMVAVAGSIGIIGVSMVLAISAGVQNYISDMENDMLSGYPVAITQSTYDFSSLMSISQDNTKVDLKELAAGNKVYVNSLLDTLGTFAQGFEKTNNISEAYIDYVSKMPQESVNVIQYQYSFSVVNNIYTDFTVSNDLSSHFKEGDSWDFNGGTMSVAAIRSMYASVLSKVEEYKQWGSMISTVETFSEVPNNFDYIMSQYDVVVADINGVPVKSGYSQEQLKEIFESKETLIMVLDKYRFNDLMLAQFGYFTEDEFLDYAFAGVGSEEDVTLVGSDGFPYSFFVGDNAKKFTYYPNDTVYSLHEYKAQPKVSDDDIRNMMKLMGGDAGKQLAEAIINARNTSDEALRAILQSFSGQYSQEEIENYFEMFRLPGADETTEGFIANAYDTEFVINDGGNAVVLPAFENTSTYDKRVDLGVKLILQKKESVSYGCLNTGIYYTNALTNYVLDTEEQSEIVNYINEHGALDEVPLYVNYYYVDESDADRSYVLDVEAGSIETGENMMSSILGSITGSTTSITAGIVGGSRLPKAIFMYPVDFEYKDMVTGHLDAWNDMCDAGSDYVYTDLNGNEQTVTLTVQDRITYTDTVGMIIAMVNTMIKMITIALIAFTALALVVSTVMVGIITYVSVVERVKEIGILRAVGARKKDIKRLFNAETFIIGFAAGVVGILITYLLSLILNIILGAVAGVTNIAALPIWQALIMIGVSIVLTLISGLIPASAAAKKDPVVALRTE